MSSTAERVAALRKLAEDLEVVDTLERENLAAKDAYYGETDPEKRKPLRAAKKKAAHLLNLAREEVRKSPVRDMAADGVGVSVTPPTVSK